MQDAKCVCKLFSLINKHASPAAKNALVLNQTSAGHASPDTGSLLASNVRVGLESLSECS